MSNENTQDKKGKNTPAQEDSGPKSGAVGAAGNRPRPKRTPIGTRNVMTVEGRPGYVRRWVNDTDGRIKRYEAAGYEPVKGDLQVGDPKVGDPGKLGAVVTKMVGGGKTAILMEIPEEYYREDQEAKMAKIKAEEQDMTRDRGKPTASSPDGMYGKVTLTQ